MTAFVPQSCQRWRLKLAAAHPADLEPAERAALEAHLATCAACAAVYAAYVRMDAAVQRLPAPPPLEDLPPKLLALWAAEDHQAEDTPVPLARRERTMRPNIVDTVPTPIFPESPAPRRRSRRLVSGVTVLVAVLVIALLTAALLASRFNNPHTGPTANPGGTSPTPVVTASGTASVPAGGIPIQVYFSKLGQTDVNAVFPVERYTSSSADQEAFSIQSLIAGPMPLERSGGYYSELNSLFTGPSSGCDASNPTIGGPDFILKLDMKGSTPEQGTATLQFCRPISSPGVNTDGRVKAEITATLEQFSSIKKVVILLQNGQCFGDESGANLCLR